MGTEVPTFIGYTIVHITQIAIASIPTAAILFAMDKVSHLKTIASLVSIIHSFISVRFQIYYPPILDLVNFIIIFSL